jgi:hypothetical protein
MYIICIDVYYRHEFHKGCVDPWLLEHRTCPMCKMDILKYYGYIVSGVEDDELIWDIVFLSSFKDVIIL